MTSSAKCHKCEKTAYRFHYTKERKLPTDPHEGYWYCDEHHEERKLEKPVRQLTGKDRTAGMNRRERRLYKRTGKEMA